MYKNYVKVSDRFEYRDCVFCGKPFKPKQRDNARFCSASCNGRHKKYNNIEEYNEYLEHKSKSEGIAKPDSKVFVCPETNKTIYINGGKGNALKNHLRKCGFDEWEYFEKHLPDYLIRCKLCDKPFKIKFNLEINGTEKRFCCHEHYYEHKSTHSECYFSEESNKKQSETMKRKIMNNEFTPCVTNSWANSRTKVTVDGTEYKFRSTWEALFWIKNQELEYECLRIPYYDSQLEKRRVYLVDFVDNLNNVVYEVKPKSNLDNQNVKDKTSSLVDWCRENDYRFEVVTEDYFLDDLDFYVNNELVNACPKLVNSVANFMKENSKNETSENKTHS